MGSLSFRFNILVYYVLFILLYAKIGLISRPEVMEMVTGA